MRLNKNQVIWKQNKLNITELLRWNELSKELIVSKLQLGTEHFKTHKTPAFKIRAIMESTSHNESTKTARSKRLKW